MKSFIITLLLIGSFSLTHAETGQELSLKKEETDGHSLKDTQQYIKEKLESIDVLSDDDDRRRFKQIINFDGCKVVIDKSMYHLESGRIGLNWLNKCDLSGHRDHINYTDSAKSIIVNASCVEDLTTYHYSGMIFTTTEKSVKSTDNHYFLILLGKSNTDRNKRIVKAFSRLSDICSKMEKPREKQNKNELF